MTELSTAKVTVMYFASMAVKTNTDQETLTVASGTTAQALFNQLNETYHFDSVSKTMRVAINHHFCEWQQPLNDGDTIAFIQPVSGG